MKRDTIPCCPPTEPPSYAYVGEDAADDLSVYVPLPKNDAFRLYQLLKETEGLDLSMRLAHLESAIDFYAAMRTYSGDPCYSTVAGHRVLVGE